MLKLNMFSYSYLLTIVVILCTHLCTADQQVLRVTHQTVEAADYSFGLKSNHTDKLSPPSALERIHSRWSDSDDYLVMSSIIFGLSKIANETYLNKECFSNFKSIEKGILERQTWAMKVLDSSGGKGSGFIWGQNYWLGSRQGCAAVQNPIHITLSNRFERTMKEGLIEQVAPFQMDYRVVYLNHNSPWQVELKFMTERVIHVGLCLPTSCTSPEIHTIMQTYFNQNLLRDGNIFDLSPKVMYIKDLRLKDGFFNKTSLKIVIGFLGFTVFMMLAARFQTICNDHTRENNKSKESNQSDLIVFVKCFDLTANLRALFKMQDSTPNSIPVINGLRSVSCFWIMIFHVVWYIYFTVNNKVFLISSAEKIFFQHILNATLLVDLFFTISGFLLTYNLMRSEKRLKDIRNSTLGRKATIFAQIVFHRLLRLAPPYLVLIGLVEVFTFYAQDVSMFHIHERYDLTCSKHWWRNVFFIQNLFDFNEVCLNWSWSLACDMQFFCLTALLLISYTKHPRLVKTLISAGLIATVSWTYILGYKLQYQFSADVVSHTITELYINPFVRILPYFLGSITGWYLVQKKSQIELSLRAEKCCWNMAILVFLICIYFPITKNASVFYSISSLIVRRTGVSLAVCWMIIGSATGRGSWWSRILECRFFQHVNRVSYAIYLLNPFAIASVFSLSKTSYYADPLQLCVLTSGFAVIVYILSIVFSLAFEMPYCNWSSAMLRRKLKAA